jgi:hypothetical protein
MVEQADKLLRDRSLWADVQEQLVELAGEHFSTEAFERAIDEGLLSCGLAPAQR